MANYLIPKALVAKRCVLLSDGQADRHPEGFFHAKAFVTFILKYSTFNNKKMTRNRYIFTTWWWLLLLLPLGGCLHHLDQQPQLEFTSADVYADADNYIQVLAKCYAALAVTGQQGPSGNADIAQIDEGFSSYLRVYWKLQELPTDEAVIGWGDPTLPDLNYATWGTGNDFVNAMYNRIFFLVVLTNEFIRETSDERLDERGFSADEISTIKTYQAEARFLRALAYWHALDMFGNVPFVTEEDPIGSDFPEQTNRNALFGYLEAELNEIIPLLIPAGQNEYGRADQAAARMLLAKLYLNAEVYVGTARYNDVVSLCQEIVDSGYQLHTSSIDDSLSYQELFLANNHTANGVIFPVVFDGLRSQTFGGTTFLVHATIGGDMLASKYGVNGGWQGIRSTPSLVSIFDPSFDPAVDTAVNVADRRALFFTDGQSAEISSISRFTDGFAMTKWRNVIYQPNATTGRLDTIPGSDPTGDFVDTDYPLFRLADAYLMYAEAVLRGGGGNQSQALDLINQIRRRAGAPEIGSGDLTLDFILDERARELYWEGHRRTDLIRYGLFAGDTYLWPFKGDPGATNGTAIPEYRRLLPIPASDINANPNLTQNPGY